MLMLKRGKKYSRDTSLMYFVHVFASDRLSKVIRSLQFVDKFGAGYDLDIRANGDRAVRETLDVLQKLRPE